MQQNTVGKFLFKLYNAPKTPNPLRYRNIFADFLYSILNSFFDDARGHHSPFKLFLLVRDEVLFSGKREAALGSLAALW